jgi:signal transduction histidine kinase
VSRLVALFLPELKPGSMVLKGYSPLRAERSLSSGSDDNPVMGILEFTQDVTADYLAVLNFERLVVFSSLLTSLALFWVIMSVIRRADRMNMERLAEKERLERELLQQEKLAGMGRMVAGVAHEIRNPLGIICSSAELVLKKARAESPSYLRILEALFDEARRLSRTVGDFLDYARPRQPRRDDVDLCRVLEQAAVFLEPECEKKKVVIDRDCPPALVVKGDKDLLYRAFYNVVANAMQAMEPGGGTIRIRGAIDGEAVRVTLTDTGPGFPADNLDKVKDPFFTTKDSGTGLGLAIVQSIIESHGAALALSNPPEGGARVDITFPRT